MLGWMLKRSVGAPDPVAEGDTTLADQPDTPAPVFAARAFKSALFGAPAASSAPKASAAANVSDIRDTPSKPPGILLTPGTGTTRRKRVSFGHDVGASAGTQETGQRAGDGAGRNRKRTRLTTALENASRKPNAARGASKSDGLTSQEGSDSEWEEEDEQDPHDFTVDLAEPHSESGKYWKNEFHKYRDDAKVEMDKMLKYKRLAKSYAKLKDAEAMKLAEMLRDEQQKVIAMEKKISESASTIVSQQKRSSSDKAVSDTVAKLTKQTALVVQYRQRVQELEDQLDELVRKKDEGEMDKQPHSDSNAASSNTVAELRAQIADLTNQLRDAKAFSGAATPDSARTRELRSQLRAAKEDSRKKDAELKKLRREYEASQQSNEARVQEMRDLLSQAQNRYADLKKEMAASKAENAAQHSRPRSWHNAPTAPAEQNIDLAVGDSQHTSDHARTTALSRRQTLRDKFRKDAAETEPEVPGLDTASPVRPGRALLDPPVKEHVRRSPRNRAYDSIVPPQEPLTEARSMRSRPTSLAAPDLPTLARTVSQTAPARSNNRTDEGVDLLKTQFAKLGGPDMAGNNSTVLGNATSKSILPPERRAAALARLERKKIERQRTKTKPGFDKENMRPIGA